MARCRGRRPAPQLPRAAARIRARMPKVEGDSFVSLSLLGPQLRVGDHGRTLTAFGYRFGQLLGYFGANLAGDVPAFAVDLILTDPPTITTAVD